jgi:hypothetical protein
MTGNKYDKQVIRDPWVKSINPEIVEPVFHFDGEKDGRGVNYCLSRTLVAKTFLMIKEPHKHEFDQIVFFLGTNPQNDKEFDAEIEFYLGDEREKKVITSPTAVYIPAGLSHGPLFFKRIGKTVEFLDTILTATYIRKPVKGGG